MQENDIIVDDKVLEMSMNTFLGYVRPNYPIGDTIRLLNLLVIEETRCALKPGPQAEVTSPLAAW